MYNKKSLEDVNVKGKRVFVRVDFNVPMAEGKVSDDTRIRAAIPTIDYLVKQGAKVILASHLGRPKGEVNEEMRLTAAGERLAELMDKPVKKLDESIGEAVEAAVAACKRAISSCLKTFVSTRAKKKMTKRYQKSSRVSLTFT